MAVVSMSYLLEAGVHFGHQTKRWNPKMKEYIFGAREDIYIIDLEKTTQKLEEAYVEIKNIADNGGTFLFVGTKKQSQEVASEEAIRSNSYYVTERWLGGTLTNFRTIRRRVKRLEEIEAMETNGKFDVLPKKEVIGLKKEYEKLNKILCGIRAMDKLPNALIIVDPKKEINAIREARKLRIPVFGIVDTNCDPDDVDYVIPGNDDAVRSVKVLLGVLNNAICESRGLEMVDYVTEDEKKTGSAKTMDELIKEEPIHRKDENRTPRKFREDRNSKPQKYERGLKEESEPKKEIKEEVKIKKEETIDYSAMTLTELKSIAKKRGVKGYSTMKKDELIENLK